MAASEKKADLASLRERVRDEPSRSKRNELRAKIRKLEAEIKNDEEQEDEPRPTRDRENDENDEEARQMQKRQKAISEANTRSLSALKKQVAQSQSHRSGSIAAMLQNLGRDPARSFGAHAQSSNRNLDLECLASLGEDALQRAGLLPAPSPLQPLGDGRLGAGPMTPTQARAVQAELQQHYGKLVR